MYFDNKNLDPNSFHLFWKATRPCFRGYCSGLTNLPIHRVILITIPDCNICSLLPFATNS